MSVNEPVKISVSNQKGGVGKTIISAHLAAALAEHHDVLAVDLDPQGSLSQHARITQDVIADHVTEDVFEIKRAKDKDGDELLLFPVRRRDGTRQYVNLNRRLPAVYEAFHHRRNIDSLGLRLRADGDDDYEIQMDMMPREPAPLSENVAVETTEGFDIIPSNRRMKGVEKTLNGQRDGHMRLNEVLDGTVDDYDYVIIDTPANIDRLKDCAIVAASNVVVPVQLEANSVSATRDHIGEIESVGDGYGLDPEIIATVPNRYRNDGESIDGAAVLRKGIPDRFWRNADVERPADFDPETLPDAFWRGKVYNGDGSLIDGVPEQLKSFWETIRFRPFITDNRDYTDRVTDFNIRTRVSIKEASKRHRTLKTHDPECDQWENFQQLASVVEKQTGGQLIHG